MSENDNDNQPDISLSEVFGQEMEEYLHTTEAQDSLADHSLYEEGEAYQRRRGNIRFSHPDSDPFFDDVSPEEFGMNTEDLFGMSVLVPLDEHVEMTGTE